MLDSKRIAKNTIILYLRMLLLMVVSLYTSRIILEALGISDYGIYNVVGGIVIVLAFLNNTLSTAAARFITVILGRGDKEEQKRIFANILAVCFCLSAIIVVLAETVGLYILYHYLRIPAERFYAASWVYHISVATVIINILSIPYNATIIAHERIKAFAYISIFDAISKLVVAFVLLHLQNIDKLIVYAILLFLINLVNRAIYGQYCLRHFVETKFTWSYDKQTLKDIFHFILWSSYGSFVSVGFTQGINILLNMFFGPVVNAARGVSVQVQNAVVQFITNFQTALNPQLIKCVSTMQYIEAKKLFVACSKYSFFLLCILGVPIIIEADYILALWLKDVPQFTVIFVRLMLIISICDSLANPLRIVNQAEGNIKKFQLYECSILLLIVPLSYLALKIYNWPAIVFVVHLLLNLMAQYVRVYIVLPKIGMSIYAYLKEVVLPITPVLVLPLFLGTYLSGLTNDRISGFILSVLFSVSLTLVMIYWVGLKKTEREKIVSILTKYCKWKKS